jgi:hypothetical protein
VRLTLRTLLAYLDDTLDPAQAKAIGQKVAESETAQELIARIKQVTRRRRLTSPPATGPAAKIDANTVAEYLDNIIAPEQQAEVEQICLSSDVHLAEVGACHQILALVLGEPALVPPTAKQRMYGLVKGPEAIPFRRPPARTDREHEPAEDVEADETLRLGLPSYRKGTWAQRARLIGAGLVAVAILVYAVLQIINPPGPPRRATAPSMARADGEHGEKEVPEGNGKQVQDKKKDQKEDKNGKTVEPIEHKDKKSVDQVKDDKIKGKEAGKVEKKRPDLSKPVPFEPPSTRQVVVGYFRAQATNVPSILLQAQTGRTEWKRVHLSRPDVYSARPMVSLPGYRSMIHLESGLRLTLWGQIPEIWPMPPLFESYVEIHHNPKLDLDLTLGRGRILVMNTKEDHPMRVRVRFENPLEVERNEYFDFILQDKNAEVLIDRWGRLLPGEPFYPEAKDTNRLGPAADLSVVALSGEIYLHFNTETHLLVPPGKSGPTYAKWESNRGLLQPQTWKELPEGLLENPRPMYPPGLPKDMLEKMQAFRSEMLKARDELSTDLSGKDPYVGLAEAVNSKNQAKQILAVRSYGAIDDLLSLVDGLRENLSSNLRMTALITLQNWMTTSRDAEYKLFDVLKSKYKAGEANIIMALLHNTYHTAAALSRPETYETLIQYLTNDVVAIRELAAYHLYQLAPAGRNIRYRADDPEPARRAAQDEWLRLIPPGRLPPQQPPAGTKQ